MNNQSKESDFFTMGSYAEIITFMCKESQFLFSGRLKMFSTHT